MGTALLNPTSVYGEDNCENCPRRCCYIGSDCLCTQAMKEEYAKDPKVLDELLRRKDAGEEYNEDVLRYLLDKKEK